MTEPHRAASQTALMVAAYRGRATNQYPAICNDPWAASFAGADGLTIAEKTDALYGHMELWIALRTHYLDSSLQRYSQTGIDQVVILGAGLDTRSARIKRPDQNYYLVDHPASQADRQARIETHGSYPEDTATTVPCDFEHQSFVDQLVAHGFDTSQPAVIVWEGVIYYLQEAAARHTLTQIASRLHPNSVLLFDYLSRRLVEAQQVSREDEALVEQLVGLGEPLKFGLNDPTPLLAESGFRHVRTASFDEIALAATGTYQRDRQFRFQHVATASVEQPLLPW